MQKVFVESLGRHFNHLKPDRLFPRLQELTDIHTGYDFFDTINQREMKLNSKFFVGF